MAGIPFELKGKTVFVAGHGGMVGAALVRRLAPENVELLMATTESAAICNGPMDQSWKEMPAAGPPPARTFPFTSTNCGRETVAWRSCTICSMAIRACW